MRTSGSEPAERPEGRKEQGVLPQGKRKKECKRQSKGERNTYEQLWESESKTSKGDFGEIHVQASDLLEPEVSPPQIETISSLKYHK